MPTQPTTLPLPASAPNLPNLETSLTPPHRRSPSAMRLGIVLACMAVVLTGIVWTWESFGLAFMLTNGGFRGFQTYIQIQDGLLAAESLLAGVGFFLILTGVLRLLRRAHILSSLGPVLVLVGGLVSGLIYLALVVLSPVTIPPFATPPPAWLMSTLEGALISGTVASALGMVLSLVAIARGVLSRGTVPAPTVPT